LLAQTCVKGVGQCVYAPKQLLGVLMAMEGRLDPGMRADASFFPETDGFENNFVPALWPQ